MAHWATLTLSQMLWGHSKDSVCVRKNFLQADFFFSTRLKRGIATATRQPEKNLSACEKFFLTIPHTKGKQKDSPRSKWIK